MKYTMTLPTDFETKDIRTLLEQEWLVPRKVRHFLRIRKNVYVNDQRKMFHELVQAGDKVTLIFEATDYAYQTVALWAKPIEILYEDEHLLIVDKPAGIKTHPNQPDENGTLLNQVAAYLAAKKEPMPHVVHRLDKETSGAILFAKNPFVLPILSRMLEQKAIKRTYAAEAKGLMTKENFTIDKKIGRNRHDKRKRIIDEKNGQAAITYCHVIATDTANKHTFLTCKLATGRTHQIRVHLTSLNHPIIGDPLYTKDSENYPRMMLHSQQLSLIHPFTKERIVANALKNHFAPEIFRKSLADTSQ